MPLVSGRDSKRDHVVHIDPTRVESFEFDGKTGNCHVSLYSGRNHTLTGEQARAVYAGLVGAATEGRSHEQPTTGRAGSIPAGEVPTGSESAAA